MSNLDVWLSRWANSCCIEPLIVISIIGGQIDDNGDDKMSSDITDDDDDGELQYIFMLSYVQSSTYSSNHENGDLVEGSYGNTNPRC